MIASQDFHATGTIGEIGETGLALLLRGPGLRLRIGDIVADIKSRERRVIDHLFQLYHDYQAVEDELPDFYFRIRRSAVWRQALAPQVVIDVDCPSPISPLPASFAPLGLEIGLNWQMAARNDRYLTCHAAAVAHDGAAAMMPGGSGSGKSTLAAALMLKGVRLLSDEFGLICPVTGRLVGYPRPISLKNESISVIDRRPNDGLALSGELSGTPKGTIRYLQASPRSIAEAAEPVACRLIIFPEYSSTAAAAELAPVRKAEAFIRLVNGATNYEKLGIVGFQRICDLVQGAGIFHLRFRDIDEAARIVMDQLVSSAPAKSVGAAAI